MSKTTRARPPADLDDKMDMEASGSINAVVGGVRYQLRRPNIGQLRDFNEALAELSNREKALKADGPLTEEGQAELDAGVLAWWRNVVADLEKGGAELPVEDRELPPWLLQRALLAEARSHWLTVPWGPGGSPSQQEAQRLKPLLDQASKLLASVQQT